MELKPTPIIEGYIYIILSYVKDWLLIVFSWSMIKDTVNPINLFG